MKESVLIQYLNGKLSTRQAAKIEHWYGQSPENATKLEHIYYLLQLENRISDYQRVDVERSLRELKQRSNNNKVRRSAKKRIRLIRLSIISACAVVCIMVGGAVFKAAERMSTPIVFRTGIGERAEFTMTDGTSVIMNSCGTLTYSQSLFSPLKKADFEGEAYFNVAKSDKKHLEINAKGVLIEILGTKFNVKAHDEEDVLVVTMFEGKVRVSSSEGRFNSIIIKADQQLAYNTQTNDCVVTDYDPEVNDMTSWTSGKLHFANATLIEIATELKRKYDVEFVFKDIEVKNERFTCSFDSYDSVADIMSVLGLTYKFDHKIDGRTIYVYSRK